MLEYWNMNFRLLMLILAVGAFVSIWSGDHQQSNRSLTESVHPNIRSLKVTLIWLEEERDPNPVEVSSMETGYCIECLPEAAWFPSMYGGHYGDFDSEALHHRIASIMGTAEWELASTTVRTDVPRTPVIPQTAVTVVDCDVPLPVDLAPGEYRIVNDLGAVYWKKWTADDLAYLGISDSAPPQDIYILNEDARKWVFMRVNQSSPFADSLVKLLFQAKENIEMSASRFERVYGSVRETLKSAVGATGAWSEMMAEAFLQMRNQWNHASQTAKKTEKTEAPVSSIQNANRFRCRQFY